ncbi:helix-turn-helix domain-containing protein [Streptomyces sp. CB01373]|uniref:helix-turn-helix domain-containing protein n=1 Tax=Streptomyces sp. CB01373 TaxID=2020325 RepID=UPI0018FECECC|nr:helix-turn-helix domain-containing protein [Streptomyces sp. CB01373]
MGTPNPSVPPHAQSRIAGDKHPNRGHHTGGLVHDNTRHTTRFTVIGNHLAQHRELSLLAIGLGVHLQSLPKGARVDIKTLTVRFPEGATRIAAALRELESHGYLRRPRERAPGGRIVTRTISCNQPAAARHHHADAPDPAPDRPARPVTAPTQTENRGSREERESGGEKQATCETGRPRGKRPPRKPLPAVPRPACSAPALLKAATDLLADLRRHDSRLLLSACDTAHLAPGVAAWLEREVGPAAVRQALTADLPPEELRRPAAVLAHRLTAQLPPPLPFRAPAVPPPVRHPLQTCEGCDRAFRAPEPGRCRDCRTDLQEDA